MWHVFCEDHLPCIILKNLPKNTLTLLSQLKCSVVSFLMLAVISEMVSATVERSVVSCMFMIVGVSVDRNVLVPTHTDTLRQVREDHSSQLQCNKQICRDFMRGQCQRKNCKFLHVFPQSVETAAFSHAVMEDSPNSTRNTTPSLNGRRGSSSFYYPSQGTKNAPELIPINIKIIFHTIQLSMENFCRNLI